MRVTEFGALGGLALGEFLDAVLRPVIDALVVVAPRQPIRFLARFRHAASIPDPLDRSRFAVLCQFAPGRPWQFAPGGLCQFAPGRPWQSLYFLPDPQGHGALRPGSLELVAVAAPCRAAAPPPDRVSVPPSSVGPL